MVRADNRLNDDLGDMDWLRQRIALVARHQYLPNTLFGRVIVNSMPPALHRGKSTKTIPLCDRAFDLGYLNQAAGGQQRPQIDENDKQKQFQNVSNYRILTVGESPFAVAKFKKVKCRENSLGQHGEFQAGDTPRF